MHSRRHSQRKQTEQVLMALRLLIAKRGQEVLENLRRYGGMCLKAEALRRWGLTVQVRGQWRRWLVVIEGRKGQRSHQLSLETKALPPPRSPQEVLPPPWFLWF